MGHGSRRHDGSQRQEQQAGRGLLGRQRPEAGDQGTEPSLSHQCLRVHGRGGGT